MSSFGSGPLPFPVRSFELPTIGALLAQLAKKVEIVGIKNAAKTAKELQDLTTILKYAAGKKAKFRFYREF